MIIGLSGQAGCGKSTVAKLLVEHYEFVEVALADPIKRIAAELWDWDENTLWGPSSERNKPDVRYRLTPNKETQLFKRTMEDIHDMEDQEVFGGDGPFLTPRHALQKIGTEVARAVDPDVWVRYMMKVARKLIDPERFAFRYDRVRGLYRKNNEPIGNKANGVVIPDCRFKNEFKAVKDCGYLVRIKRPGAGLKGEDAQHASEAEQREIPDEFFDFVIDNVSTPHELRLSVDSMMSALNGQMIQYDVNGDDEIPPFKRV